MSYYTPVVKTVSLQAETTELIIQWKCMDSKIFFKIKSQVESVPGVYWDGSKNWYAPDTIQNRELLKRFGFLLPVGYNKNWVPPWKGKIIPKEISEPLRTYQVEGVQFIDYLQGKGLLADDMGLGKTVQSLSYLRLHPEFSRVLIITEASLKLQWREEVKKWGERTPIILFGKTPYELPEGIFIINWDVIHDWELELIQNPWDFIIGDEIQAIGNMKSLRSRTFMKLARRNSRVLGMSGTPFNSKTVRFYPILSILDHRHFYSSWNFKQRYCDPKYTPFGLTFDGASNTEELRALIQPIMLRRTKKEVAKDLPRKIRIALPLEIKDIEKYKEAEKAVFGSISDFSDNIRDKELADLQYSAFQYKKDVMIKWIQEFLDKDQKLICFAFHRKVVEYVHEKFKKNSVMIYGGISTGERQKRIDKFMNSSSTNLLIGNFRSAGIGLNLTAATAVCFLELSSQPEIHMQCEDRICRIGSTFDRVFAYYPFVAGTIEEEWVKVLDNRMKNYNRIMEGRETRRSEMIREIIKHARRKHEAHLKENLSE